MFIIISIKSFIIFVSLIGLFFGLFPDIPKKAPQQTVVAAPVIDNVYAAMVHAPDDSAREAIGQAHEEEQVTTRQASDNAAQLAMYSAQQVTARENLANNNRLMFWMLIGLVGIAIPLPKKREQLEVQS